MIFMEGYTKNKKIVKEDVGIDKYDKYIAKKDIGIDKYDKYIIFLLSLN